MLRRYLAGVKGVLRALSRRAAHRRGIRVEELHDKLAAENVTRMLEQQRAGEWEFERDPLGARFVPDADFDSPFFLEAIERQTRAGQLPEAVAADLETTGAFYAAAIRRIVATP